MAADVFSAKLGEEERLLWMGKPAQGLRLTARDMFLVPFSLVWLAFVIFWIAGALRQRGGFWLYGLPFVAVGLYFVAGRFVVESWIRRSIEYAITNQRVLVSRTRPRAFTALSLERLPA